MHLIFLNLIPHRVIKQWFFAIDRFSFSGGRGVCRLRPVQMWGYDFPKEDYQTVINEFSHDETEINFHNNLCNSYKDKVAPFKRAMLFRIVRFFVSIIGIFNKKIIPYENPRVIKGQEVFQRTMRVMPLCLVENNDRYKLLFLTEGLFNGIHLWINEINNKKFSGKRGGNVLGVQFLTVVPRDDNKHFDDFMYKKGKYPDLFLRKEVEIDVFFKHGNKYYIKLEGWLPSVNNVIACLAEKAEIKLICVWDLQFPREMIEGVKNQFYNGLNIVSIPFMIFAGICSFILGKVKPVFPSEYEGEQKIKSKGIKYYPVCLINDNIRKEKVYGWDTEWL